MLIVLDTTLSISPETINELSFTDIEFLKNKNVELIWFEYQFYTPIIIFLHLGFLYKNIYPAITAFSDWRLTL